MPANKDRLYVVLHARSGGPKMPGGEDKYHWSLLLAPKKEKEDSCGIQMHAKNVIQPSGLEEWVFEQVDNICLTSTGTSLVRILIAKIEDKNHLLELMRTIPVAPDVPGWSCVSWVKDALHALHESKGILGRGLVEWERVRDAAICYVTKKRDEGRFSNTGDWDKTRVATYDLIEDLETVP